MHFVDNYSVRMVESYKQPLETIKEPGYLLPHSFATLLLLQQAVMRSVLDWSGMALNVEMKEYAYMQSV
jgi:hypothetical protein